MKKAVLIPDSFKGTLSSTEICSIMKERIHTYYPGCEVVSIPVADGGEGSVDAFLTAVGGEKITLTVENPYFEPMKSFYGLIDGGKTAVIEMASCAGLPLVEDRKDPRKTTTYGVGKLILAAAGRGISKLVVGLGGSATNDGGCGAAAAFGVRFYNKDGEEFVPTGGTLIDIDRIDMSGRSSALDGVEVVTMCDIDNPMYGPTGASHIFGPQKGADPAMVEELDRGVVHLCEVIRRDLGMDLSEVPGGGAAGAMGAGMIAFFGSRLQMGIETGARHRRFRSDDRGRGPDPDRRRENRRAESAGQGRDRRGPQGGQAGEAGGCSGRRRRLRRGTRLWRGSDCHLPDQPPAAGFLDQPHPFKGESHLCDG